MTRRCFLDLLYIPLILCMASVAVASPRDDLSSPSQEVRDAAAKIVRETFVPSPRERWEPIVEKIKPGDSKSVVFEKLGFKPENEWMVRHRFGGVEGYSSQYQLDDTWKLSCSFTYRGDKLTDRRLIKSSRGIWVDPPPNFSGIWVTYFANGQKRLELSYQNGKQADPQTWIWYKSTEDYTPETSKEVTERPDSR